ncbi:MAG TPA: chemotaxis protein CheW, partial [Sphingomonas sp.]
AKLLGVQSHAAPGRSILIVVRASSGERYALSVDCVQDHEELVVKPAAPAIMATGVYAGTTLPDNGRPMLLINPAGVAQVAGVRAPDAAIPAKIEAEEARVETVPTLLFRACDDAVRAIRLSLVERIEDVAANAIAWVGGRLRLSHDGRIVPLFGCDRAVPDKNGRVRVLLLGDGTTEVAYAIGEVIDIHALAPDFLPAAEPGLVAGVMLVGDIQVELVDCFWLFGQAGTLALPSERPLCVLDGTDPWMRDILRPIVEQAGYRVGWSGEDDETAAVAILSADKTTTMPLPAASVIRLRSTADETAASAGSIYRYDRHGLIAALAAVQGKR